MTRYRAARNYRTAALLAGSAGVYGFTGQTSSYSDVNSCNNSNNNITSNHSNALVTPEPMNLHQKLSPEARAAEFVTTQCIIQGVPGCTVAVIKDGELIWSYCYGYSDVANNQLLTPYSIMRIASVTKPLTATGIAILIQHAKISQDETVYDLLERLTSERAKKIRTSLKKKYPNFYETHCKKIKILHLCNHTAGLRHYNSNEEYLSTKRFHSLMGVLANFATEDILFEPGTKYYYSSYGYIMLGLIIEAVSNMKYEDFMQEEVLKPLGMNHTFLETDHQKIIPNQAKQYIRKVVDHGRASDYVVDEGGSKKVYEIARGGEKRPKYKDCKIRKLSNAPYSDSTIKVSSGGFMSCAIDVARFGNEVVLGDFLSKRIQKMVFETNLIIRPKNEENLDEDDEEENDDIEDFGYKDIEYGLGWHVYRKILDPLTYTVEEICHGGGANGGCAHLLILPQKKISVAVLMNLQQAKPTISRDIAKFFYNDY
eukprot:CAMPEP_0202701760 /NCGR_PEP_ID=MMETSP1385-20130828/14820_1 /ASSEMBLY_ACC=CAM_ASM_000861 /TAXON_ID=933848 /ORGANISM="Elphidium margaritaceum" /LENGTH=483 /DNA_ID=CAMNT_0049359243 /DNA_START=30 /DNA_END=1484 /DNA_ORIENTATION=-